MTDMIIFVTHISSLLVVLTHSGKGTSAPKTTIFHQTLPVPHAHLGSMVDLPMDPRLILGAAAAVSVLVLSKKNKTVNRQSQSAQKISPQATLMNPAASMRSINLPEDEWPEMKFDIPFAAGDPNPVWPIMTDHKKKFIISYRTASGAVVGNGSRRFMANRDGGNRYHVGVDLYGNKGDVVMAMEDGTIVNHYHLYHGAYALIVQCKSGLVINYGEVERNSWKEFGLGKGSKVVKGQAIARIALMSGGSHMTHFEAYMPPTEQNERYRGGDVGPILNPTYYLLRARSLADVGRSFSSTDCIANASFNRVIPENLIPIAIEDKRVGETRGDSVLAELLIEDQWRPDIDMADGP